MYLLDTEVLAELGRRQKIHPAVARWANSVTPLELFLSAISLLEIEAEALRLEASEPAQGAALRTWVDQKVIPAFDGRVLPVDLAVAQQSARLHVLEVRAERDALIAATALVHRLVVVTRRAGEFKRLGVGVLDPWNEQ